MTSVKIYLWQKKFHIFFCEINFFCKDFTLMKKLVLDLLTPEKDILRDNIFDNHICANLWFTSKNFMLEFTLLR